ncbi:MAG TPA: hypothetical protein VM262_13380, partial [Acidimicrobiales bacterium]|nr:hypothetical protein [Acidimicrobiales bacterium]
MTGAGAPLEPEREFLVRSIEDLDREHAAGELTDEDHRDLRARYEAKLAALDTPPAPSVSTYPRRTMGGSTPKRGVGRVIATVAVVAVVG